jgi:hypothetical protein
MNPESHLIVRFLRFLNFNEAADLMVRSLLKEIGKIDFCEEFDKAKDELLMRVNELPLGGFFDSRQASLFAEISQKYNLKSLSSVVLDNHKITNTSNLT